MGFPTPFVRSVRNADSEPTTYLEDRDLIVLTQTCDIPKPAQQTILLAQVVSYDALASKGGTDMKGSKYRRKLVENIIQPFFPLRPFNEPALPWSLVCFRDLHVAPKDEVQLFTTTAGLRLRLRSPYREHLAQSYARFMMRVGLPSTTDDFEKYEPGSSE